MEALKSGACARPAASSRTRSAAIGRRAAEVYLHWVLTYLYEADVEIITDHAVKRISGADVEVANLYAPAKTRRLAADTIVMATARTSENALYRLLRTRGRSVEAIGCAVAPRTVYEAAAQRTTEAVYNAIGPR